MHYSFLNYRAFLRNILLILGDNSIQIHRADKPFKEKVQNFDKKYLRVTEK